MLDTDTKHQTAAGNFYGPFRVRGRRTARFGKRTKGEIV